LVLVPNLLGGPDDTDHLQVQGLGNLGGVGLMLYPQDPSRRMVFARVIIGCFWPILTNSDKALALYRCIIVDRRQGWGLRRGFVEGIT